MRTCRFITNRSGPYVRPIIKRKIREYSIIHHVTVELARSRDERAPIWAFDDLRIRLSKLQAAKS